MIVDQREIDRRDVVWAWIPRCAQQTGERRVVCMHDVRRPLPRHLLGGSNRIKHSHWPLTPVAGAKAATNAREERR